MPRMIFYPDAHPETYTVDGWVRQYDAAGLSWSAIVAAAGYDASDSGVTNGLVSIQADAATNKWQQITRVIMLFDTSTLPDDCTITRAYLSLYSRGPLNNVDYLSILPDLNIYSANPASNTALVAGDYDSLGTIPYCNLATPFNVWLADGYIDLEFNAVGIAAISKTGITKLGARNANYDAINNAPTWSAGQDQSQISFYAADKGDGYKPALVVVYETESQAINEQDIVTLEALRNIEMMGLGRLYIDEQGNVKYESRFHRSI